MSTGTRRTLSDPQVKAIAEDLARRLAAPAPPELPPLPPLHSAADLAAMSSSEVNDWTSELFDFAGRRAGQDGTMLSPFWRSGA